MGSISNDLSTGTSRKNPASDINKRSIALVGVGQWGTRVLAPELRSEKLSHLVGSIALVDWNVDERLVQSGKGFTVYDPEDYSRLLSDKGLDAVIIATPDDSHYQLTKSALLAGKHVFVEKCFVKTVGQARELVGLAREMKLCLMVGYEYMFDYRFAALKKLLDSGKSGKLIEVNINLINRHVPDGAQAWGDANIIEHHTSHQLSILQLLLGNHIPDDIIIHEAKKNYTRLSFRYRGVDVFLSTGIDYPSTQNYRHIEIKGSRLNVNLDFDGNNAEFLVEFAGNHEEVDINDPSYPEELRNLNTEPCVHSELKHFFHRINSHAEGLSGGGNAVHLIELVTLIGSHYQMREAIDAGQSRQRQQNYHAAVKDEIFKLNKSRGFDLDTDRYFNILADTISLLRKKPYISAVEVCRELSLESGELKILYKLIQGSPVLQRELRQDAHFDYFNVVESFFYRNHYEATFFVGVVCPYKCSFCKMTMTALPVPEETPRFEHKKSNLLKDHDIDNTLDVVKKISMQGKTVTVKISGGLEPLTDMKRVRAISESAISRSLPVKLYTNGALIDSQETRDLLLQFSDIRVSLNTISEKKYRQVYLDRSDGKKTRVTLSKLIGLLERLIQDKCHLQSTTRIGFNFVVIRETILDMEKMARLAGRIGLDYINYNIDYFDEFSDKEFIAIHEKIKRIKELKNNNELGGLHVNFGGSLLRENLFTQKPVGEFDPAGISRYKVFIDPAGNVTPIHEGTFAYRDENNQSMKNPYTFGQIGVDGHLNEFLTEDIQLKPVEYKYLAPLELILALEMLRLKEDEKFGFTVHDSPYNTTNKMLATV